MTTYYRLGDTIAEEKHVRAANNGGTGRWTLVVVIDPADGVEVIRLVEVLLNHGLGSGAGYIDTSAALREFAKPTPPKPEEPTGLGALVRDDEGDLWLRDGGRDDYPWARITQNVGATKSWHDKWEHIATVEVIFEGVTA